MLSEVHFQYKKLDKLVSHNYRFAIYKLPASNKLYFIQQTAISPQLYNDFLELDNKQGFVIAPFCVSKQNPIIVVSPDIQLEGEDDICNYLESITLDDVSTSTSLTIETDEGLSAYSSYESVFDTFQAKIKDGSVNKLVLSRTKDVAKDEYSSVGAIFAKALAKYPNNFVYLCHTPESGTWLGCSPEILLSGRDTKWTTHALAGTQKIASNKDAITWDDKNVREQAIVFDYIHDSLKNIGIEATSNIAKTIQSGDLVHLQSEFFFQIDNANKVGEVLALLHPTPAVCGYPKTKALDIILKHEGYNRSYYSGFIGPYNIKNDSDLYVNLRCMQLLSNNYRLYAGGGIMPQSTAQSEWQETEYKLQTILSLIE